MSSDPAGLGDFWKMRNAAATTLVLSEEQMRRAVGEASVEQLIVLLESFSPALSAGPEWTRTFDLLVERLWIWRDDKTMAALADVFRARGAAWAPVTNALLLEQGARIRQELRRPGWARLPAFTLA